MNLVDNMDNAVYLCPPPPHIDYVIYVQPLTSMTKNSLNSINVQHCPYYQQDSCENGVKLLIFKKYDKTACHLKS